MPIFPHTDPGERGGGGTIRPERPSLGTVSTIPLLTDTLLPFFPGWQSPVTHSPHQLQFLRHPRVTPARGGGRFPRRCVAWGRVFAWTQTRLHLPVWLGIGEALDEEVAGGARVLAPGVVPPPSKMLFWTSFFSVIHRVPQLGPNPPPSPRALKEAMQANTFSSNSKSEIEGKANILQPQVPDSRANNFVFWIDLSDFFIKRSFSKATNKHRGNS